MGHLKSQMFKKHTNEELQDEDLKLYKTHNFTILIMKPTTTDHLSLSISESIQS